MEVDGCLIIVNARGTEVDQFKLFFSRKDLNLEFVDYLSQILEEVGQKIRTFISK